MKRIIALIMALALVMGLAITASAADETANGTITITNATVGKTYNLYKILSATVNENGGVAYSFEDDEWKTTLTGRYFTTEEPTSGTYTPVTYIDSNGVEQIGYLTISGDNIEDLRDTFKFNNKTPDTTKTANSSTVIFEGLEPGYYVIVGKTGETRDSIATIDTVGKTNVDVIDKNQGAIQEYDKVVITDDGEKVYEISCANDDLVPVELTAKVSAYDHENKIKSYLLKDVGSVNGMSYLNELTVKVITQEGQEFVLDINDDYQLTCDGKEVTSKEISCKEFAIDIPWSDSYGAVANITVTYHTKASTFYKTAQNAFNITPYYENGGSGQPTGDKIVKYYKYYFDLKKTDGTNILNNAEFYLSTEETLAADYSNAITFNVNEGVEETDYTPAANGTTKKIVAGFVGIGDLEAGTYYLHETKAPDGYNKLTAPIKIEIDPTAEGATYANPKITVTQPGQNPVVYTDTFILEVVNQSGSKLPSTGGIGTTLFYVIGGLMMTGAAVLLITKKRMAA